ncbi:MAG: hypothetical protein ACE10G_08310 [Gemmatimonadales bacterium]
MYSTNRSRRWPVLLVAVGTIAAGACRGQVQANENAACAPTTDTLLADASATGLAGEYRITIVATVGPAVGDTARGTLSLQPYAEEMQQMSGAGGAVDPNFVTPVFGALNVDITRLGAVRLGALGSVDPNMPGVIVIERVGEPKRILLRLGSEANRRDLQRFDGGYTVLEVQTLSDDSFAGSWRSGVTRTQAEGFFCAVRVGL